MLHYLQFAYIADHLGAYVATAFNILSPSMVLKGKPLFQAFLPHQSCYSTSASNAGLREMQISLPSERRWTALRVAWRGRHLQPDLVDGDPLLLSGLWGGGALQRVPPTISVHQERVPH